MNEPDDDRITAFIDPELDWPYIATHAAYVGVMLVFGVIIGIISRGNVRLTRLLSIIVGVLSYAFMLFRDDPPSEWSRTLPVAMFHVTAAAICSVGPVLLGAIGCRRYQSQRAKIAADR
jgi:hypothetical protein